MIALGLVIELIAGALVVLGLALGADGGAVPLWASIGTALVGLAIVSAGVRRARPRRRTGGGTPTAATG